MAAPATNKFCAITVVAGRDGCGASSALDGKRILAIQAPLLPMPNCSMPERCRCRFKKYPDRRDDDEGRRFRYGQQGGAWYAGSQRRQSQGRRERD